MILEPATPQVFDLLDEVPVRVHGRSMWPWLWRGDRVRVRTDVAPQVGAVVVVLRGEEHPLIHRITALHGEQFETRGDNNMDSDGWRPASTLAGVVVSLRRWGLPMPLPPLWLVRLTAPACCRGFMLLKRFWHGVRRP